jgi:hypothetical protein
MIDKTHCQSDAHTQLTNILTFSSTAGTDPIVSTSSTSTSTSWILSSSLLLSGGESDNYTAMRLSLQKAWGILNSVVSIIKSAAYLPQR